MREAKFDRIALMELTVKLSSVTGDMVATGAFVNSQTGQTHGSTTGRGVWTAETVQALVRLRECIEADMERVHFVDGVLSSDSPLATTKGVGGLGEFLKKDDKDGVQQD